MSKNALRSSDISAQGDDDEEDEEGGGGGETGAAGTASPSGSAAFWPLLYPLVALSAHARRKRWYHQADWSSGSVNAA